MSAIAVTAMAFTMIAVPTTKAAADVMDCTSTTDWKIMGEFNSWSSEDMTAVGDGRYYYNVEIDTVGDYQFLITGTVNETETYLKDKDYNETKKNNFLFTVAETGTYQIVLDPASISVANVYWDGTYYTNVGVSAGKAVTASDCQMAIEAIGTIELSNNCYEKINTAKKTVAGYLGNTSAISNYADLATAEATFNDLVADGAGTITLYVNAPDAWTKVYIHTFGSEPATGTVANAPEWPGMELTAEKNNRGWYTITFTASAATNIIFNNGSGGEGNQTDDINCVSNGTYWYTVTDDCEYTVSTSSPAGWVDDSSKEDTSDDTSTGDDTDKNPSEDTSDVETDSVVNITEDEIKELEDAVVVEGAEDKLVISVVPEDSADLDVIAAADVLKNVKYVAVDLKFESGNQPEEGTKITFPIAKIASVKDTAYVSVYRVDADKLKLIEVVKVKDGNITFEPDHFSTYVFAEANEADYNKYLNDQEAGVSLPIVGLIAVAALAGGCVVFSLKRKHA